MEGLPLQLVDGALLFSASDLNQYLECRHLSWLDLQTALRVGPERERQEHAELLARHGSAHEAAYLARLRSEGRTVVTIPSVHAPAELPDRAAATIDAMAAGADVIYQAVFVDPPWRGYADFLERVDVPSARWPYGYEAVDTKLARHTKPYFLVQLCCYSEMIERIQGSAPDAMHLVLGDLTRESYAVAQYAPYFRRIRERFLAEMAAFLR
jgi:predicted RecB family nuclease